MICISVTYQHVYVRKYVHYITNTYIYVYKSRANAHGECSVQSLPTDWNYLLATNLNTSFDTRHTNVALTHMKATVLGWGIGWVHINRDAWRQWWLLRWPDDLQQLQVCCRAENLKRFIMWYVMLSWIQINPLITLVTMATSSYKHLYISSNKETW